MNRKSNASGDAPKRLSRDLTEAELESLRQGHFMPECAICPTCRIFVEPPTLPKDAPKCKKCGGRMVYPTIEEYFDFFEE